MCFCRNLIDWKRDAREKVLCDEYPGCFGALRSLVLPTSPITQSQFDTLCERYARSLETLEISSSRGVTSVAVLRLCTGLVSLNISDTLFPPSDAQCLFYLSQLVRARVVVLWNWNANLSAARLRLLSQALDWPFQVYAMHRFEILYDG